MDDEAGRLVDDEEVRVLVDHVERDGLRDERERLGRRNRQADQAPTLEPGAGPGRAPVDGDTSVPD